jgi:hypothetical protein
MPASGQDIQHVAMQRLAIKVLAAAAPDAQRCARGCGGRMRSANGRVTVAKSCMGPMVAAAPQGITPELFARPA